MGPGSEDVCQPTESSSRCPARLENWGLEPGAHWGGEQGFQDKIMIVILTKHVYSQYMYNDHDYQCHLNKNIKNTMTTVIMIMIKNSRDGDDDHHHLLHLQRNTK